MRIIRGTFKGRRFQLPPNLKARPTTDFAKEGLFNIIDNIIDIEGITALDLFSGTGSIGLEFVSRGAKQVFCVEQYTPHIRFIKSVADKLKIDNLHLIQGDVYRYITGCRQKFDLIFADAPYADEQLSTIPQRIFEAGLLKEGGYLIVEHSKDNHFEDHPYWKDTRVYGSVHFSFFRIPGDEPSKPEQESDSI